MNMSLSRRQEGLKDREAWHAAVHGGAKSWSQLSDWTTTATTGSRSQSPTAQTWNTDLESGRHAGSPKADLGCCGRLRRRSRPLQLRSQWPSNAVSRKSDSGSARSNMHAHSQSLSSCDIQPVWEVGKGRLKSGALRAGLQLRQCLQKQAACWAKDSSEASDRQQTTYTQRQTETFHRTVSFEK